jgi:hypothetical protein
MPSGIFKATASRRLRIAFLVRTTRSEGVHHRDTDVARPFTVRRADEKSFPKVEAINAYNRLDRGPARRARDRMG